MTKCHLDYGGCSCIFCLCHLNFSTSLHWPIIKWENNFSLSMKRIININTKSCCCAQIVWTKSNETKASGVSQAQIPRDSPSESQASTFFVFPHFSSASWHSIFFAQMSTYHIYFWVPIPSLACRFTFSCTQTQLHPSLVAATAQQPTRGWTLARRLRLIMFAN